MSKKIVTQKFIKELKEYAAVLTGPRKVTSWCGKATATYKAPPKGYGHLVINVGLVKFGEDGEEQVAELLQRFMEIIERIRAESKAQ